MTEPLIPALWFAAGAAVAWRFTALHYRDRLTAMETQRDLYKAWWERDSGKMITAQAELDLRRQRHIDAGRQSHKAERALIAEKTEELRRCVAARSIQPVAANPAPGFPAAAQRAPIEGGRGRQSPRHHGQDAGAGTSLDVTQRARTGNAPGQSCRRNRAGNFAPAETPKAMKGA